MKCIIYLLIYVKIFLKIEKFNTDDGIFNIKPLQSNDA